MMLKRLLSVIIPVLIFAGCRPSGNELAVKQLSDLLHKNDYFKLDAQFKLQSAGLGKGDRLYFKSFIDNAFNRNELCIKDIDSLLADKSVKLPDTSKFVLKQLQGDSYFKIYQYAKAAGCDSSILKYYRRGLPKEVIDDVNNNLLIRNALKTIPAQQTIIKSNTTIAWKKDGLGLVEIPVRSNSSVYHAIFDTRANISTITKTYAKKLRLHMLDVSYEEGSGATGMRFKTGMGIADSLNIGGIVVKHVVFQVMPDVILYIAPVKFQLNIIIGFPVISQLQEVHIARSGTMTIPLTPTKSDLHNFALDGLDPVIALKSGNDTLAFHFDSGASSTTLYVAYLEKYRAAILKNASKKMVGIGGAGGSQKKEVYVLPKLDFTLGGKSVHIDSVDIMMQKIYPGEKFYGNIGQDFTNKFSEVIYNFKDMYIDGIL